MELDEMKNMWQQYDKELRTNRMLNEKIISSMLKDKSKNAIRRISNMEYLGVALCVMLLAIFLLQVQSVQGGFMTACYIFSLVCIAASFSFGLYKIHFLSGTDPGMPVMETTQKMNRFRLLITREKLWTLIILPFLIPALAAVISRWLYGIDIFEHMDTYLPRMIIALIIAVPALLIVYRKLYFDTIKNIQDNLKELEEFRSS